MKFAGTLGDVHKRYDGRILAVGIGYNKKDVSVKAGGNLNIESAEEQSESEYIKSVNLFLFWRFVFRGHVYYL